MQALCYNRLARVCSNVEVITILAINNGEVYERNDLFTEKVDIARIYL